MLPGKIILILWKKEEILSRNSLWVPLALAIGGTAFGFSAKSYRNIQGANDRIRVGIIGVNGRGNQMGRTFARTPGAEVGTICDVDTRAIPKAIQSITSLNPTPAAPKSEKDCRKVLDDKTIDAIYIATPDHWHAPLTIMGCKAGKACLL